LNRKTASKSPDSENNNNKLPIKNDHTSPILQKQANASSSSYLNVNTFSKTNFSEKR
jgi:hypothetical protein